MIRFWTGFSCGLLIIFIAFGSAAQIPRLINYQGDLTDTGGTPVSATTPMDFALYAAASGGTPAWSEHHAAVVVEAGVFSVLLGSGQLTGGQPLGALPFDRSYYLDVTVDGTALSPRHRLSSVPYALTATSVYGSAGRLDVSGQGPLLTYATEATTPVQHDGVRLRYDHSFFGNQCDALLIEKTDGNDEAPDGGIALINTGSDGESRPALVVRGDGKVGIGTTTPGAPLEVAGSIQVNGVWAPGGLHGGSEDGVLGVYQHNTSWNSRAYLEMWGDHAQRAGELALTGTYVDLRYDSQVDSWGRVGLRLASTGHIGLGGVLNPVAPLTLPEGARLSLDDSADDRAIFVPTGEGEPLVLSNHSGAANPTIRFRNDADDSDTMVVNLLNRRVGIGVTTPQESLDVAGSIGVDGYLKFTGPAKSILGLDADAGFNIMPNTSAWDSRNWLTLFGNHSGRAGELELAGAYLRFRHNVTTSGWGQTGMLLASNGNLGIGTESPQYKLDVNGTIRGASVIPSDARWKTDVAPLERALERILQLQGVTFRWTDPARGAGPQIGLIAQEVETIFPELVSTDSEGYKSLDYATLVVPLVEAVKTLQAENEALKAEQTRMREEFEQRLADLEAILNP